MFEYQLADFILRCPLPIEGLAMAPEGLACQSVAQLKFGPVTEMLENAARGMGSCQIEPRRLLLKTPVGHILVADGTDITIDSPERNWHDIQAFVLGPGLAALCYQRRIPVLHGATVLCNNNAVVFAGLSASGKSTLAHAWQACGQAVLGDELCPIRLSGHDVQVLRPPQRLVLWADVLKQTIGDISGLQPVRQGLNKYALPVSETHQYQYPLKALIVLPGEHASRHDDQVTLRRQRGADALQLINHQGLYRSNWLNSMGLNREQFDWSTRLGQRVPIYTLERPWGLHRLSGVVAELQQRLESL